MNQPAVSSSTNRAKKIKTMKVFNRLVKNFRSDTPVFIKDIFMDCVNFKRPIRPTFLEV